MANSNNTTKHIDFSIIESVANGDQEFIKEILKQFIVDTTQRIETVQQAFANKQFAIATAEIHAVKGASLNLEMQKLAKLATKLELKLSQQVISGITKDLDDLETEFQQIKEQITQKLTNI